MKDDQLTLVIGGSALGFGVFGLIFPRGLAKVFGVSLTSGEFVYVMRLAGAGNLGLGINMVLAGENETRTIARRLCRCRRTQCTLRRSGRSLRIVVQADVRPFDTHDLQRGCPLPPVDPAAS